MKSTCEFKDDTIKYELIESSEGIIDDYIRINIIDYYKKSFEEELIKHVYSTAAGFPQDSNLRFVFMVENGTSSAITATIESMHAAIVAS